MNKLRILEFLQNVQVSIVLKDRLIGTYSSNTVIDISKYDSRDTNKYLPVALSNSEPDTTVGGYSEHDNGWRNGYGHAGFTFIAPSVTIKDDKLYLSVGSCTGFGGWRDGVWSKSANNLVNLYYIG